MDSKTGLAFLVIAGLVCAVYGPALNYPFQFDDHLILEDTNVTSGSWTTFFLPPKPRSLTWLGFLLQYQVSRSDPRIYRATSFALHTLVSLLVFIFLGLVLPKALHSWSWLFALFGALIFSLHPLQSETVLYVSQQSTLLAGFFALLAIIFYIWGTKYLPFIFFVLALFSKEFIAVLPLVLWILDGFLRKNWRLSKALALYLAIGLTASLVFVGWVFVSKEKTLGGSLSESYTYAATQVKVLWSYIRLALFPHPLNLDPDVAAQTSIGEFRWLLAFGLLCAAAWLVFRLRHGYPLACLFVSIFFIFLIPTSSFFPSQDYMFEHRTYLSMIGIAGLGSLGMLRFAASLTARANQRRRVYQLSLGLIGASLLSAYGLADAHRRQAWRDEITLWRDTASKSPNKYRPNYNLGVLLMNKAPDEAIVFLSRAIAINPEIHLAFRSLGQVYFDRGETESAIRLWNRALALDRLHVPTHVSLGRAYLKKFDYLNATKHFEEAQRLHPLGWQPYYYLGQLNLQFGLIEKAVSYCELGLKYNPRHPGLRFLLADVMMESGEWKRAAELYQAGLQGDPTNPIAYYKLAEIYQIEGKKEQARQAAVRGLELSDSSEEVLLGESLLKKIGLEPQR